MGPLWHSGISGLGHTGNKPKYETILNYCYLQFFNEIYSVLIASAKAMKCSFQEYLQNLWILNYVVYYYSWLACVMYFRQTKIMYPNIKPSSVILYLPLTNTFGIRLMKSFTLQPQAHDTTPAGTIYSIQWMSWYTLTALGKLAQFNQCLHTPFFKDYSYRPEICWDFA